MSDAAAASDKTVVQQLKGRVVGLAQGPVVRKLVGGIAWNLGAVAVERMIALLQSLYIARLLGIEMFGKYGLIFVTVGLLSSLIGLQLGLTAAVHVAQSARVDRPRAAAVMRLCEILSLGLGLVVFLAALVAPEAVAGALLGDTGQSDIVLAAAAIACLSVLSGVQEGILQGLERFQLLAIVRSGLAVVGIALLWLFARPDNLFSVIGILTVGVVLRVAAIALAKEMIARGEGLIARWPDVWRARRVVLGFSIPSVLASLVGGTANWYGIYLVSHAPAGFREVAVLTAGQQWRGLVLYFTTIAAGVAIPTMSRLAGEGDMKALRQVHGVNLVGNVAGASVFVVGLVLVSDSVLALYGNAFVDGRLAFWLIVATTVPFIYANVYLQFLVSQGRLWEQFGYYLAQVVPLAIGYMFLIPAYGALGFAAWTVAIGFALCLLLTLNVRIGMARQCKPEIHS